jgi:23S rRNA (adenine2503-C2)-methyltransferase
MNDSITLYDLSRDELTNWVGSTGESRYRGDQVWSGLYQHLYQSEQDFSNIPLSLKQKIATAFVFTPLSTKTEISSLDSYTHKTLHVLRDGNLIESVRMHYKTRVTLCISSQAGCPMGCVFCATGQMGFKRNLTAGEIVAQVVYHAKVLSNENAASRISNIVVMGMGEPMLNLENTIKAINILNDEKGMGFGQRRFTISTVGLAPKIIEFADLKTQINLAISLHAATDELRSSLLPVNKKYPLKALMEACEYYVNNTRRRLTFEWALIDGVNDSTRHALELASLLKGLLCHVNIIPLNPTSGYGGKSTKSNQVNEFQSVLENNNITCTIRLRRGIDINAGCGQLATHHAIKTGE